MPIYEYECRQCGHRFEYLVLSQSPAAACPECQNKDVEQLISAFGVSSETTRQANLNSARKKATVAHKEKQHEEYKQMLHHDD